jgi:hypothetical protein
MNLSSSIAEGGRQFEDCRFPRTEAFLAHDLAESARAAP